LKRNVISTSINPLVLELDEDDVTQEVPGRPHVRVEPDVRQSIKEKLQSGKKPAQAYKLVNSFTLHLTINQPMKLTFIYSLSSFLSLGKLYWKAS